MVFSFFSVLLGEFKMKGHYEGVSKANRMHGARLYRCDHPIYNKCTLFVMGDLPGYGLAVIQQRFNETEKSSWWGAIDMRLTSDISTHPAFRKYFIGHAGLPVDGIYPTIELRRLMYALGMKPLPKQYWETNLNSQKLLLL